MTVLLTALGLLGLAMVAREINHSIAQAQIDASIFAQRAVARNDSFTVAAIEFETRERLEGLRVYATQMRRPPGAFGPPPNGEPPNGAPPDGPPMHRPPPNRFLPAGTPGSFAAPGPGPGVTVVDGVVRPGGTMRGRFEGSRFGFAIATMFGVRPPPPAPFVGGLIGFAPDPVLLQNLALIVIVTVVLAAIVVGALAFAIGRFITRQAIRPLIDVTEALQRFAARDFRTQAIEVAGRSDFDVLALAYNAASAQVAAAFAERDAAEAQMRQFVADAGHELRTPLTIVLGYIDLLRRRAGAADERSKFIYSSISAEGHRMRTLVDNLVLLAKLEGDDVRPIEPFDIGELIAEIVDVRRGLDPRVVFDLDLRTDDVRAIADRTEIYEALANLIDNAIKYAPGSPIRIEAECPREGSVVISVADEGPGIAPEDRAAIFERFFRGATRGEIEGSGLGLAIAKRAIDRAGGTLQLDEDRLRGTRFLVFLRAEHAPALVR